MSNLVHMGKMSLCQTFCWPLSDSLLGSLEVVHRTCLILIRGSSSPLSHTCILFKASYIKISIGNCAGFGPQNHNSNNLVKVPLDDATYQISKL